MTHSMPNANLEDLWKALFVSVEGTKTNPNPPVFMISNFNWVTDADNEVLRIKHKLEFF